MSDFLIPLGTFFLGVFLAPAIRPLMRPLLIEVIRAGLMMSEEAKRLTAEVRENVEDAKAEVQAQRAAAATAARQAASAPAPSPDAPPPAS